MSPLIFLKLLAIFVTIGIGWVAGRCKPFAGGEAARILSNAAFYVFAPALLFRATARIDLGTLPWQALGAFFVPVVGWMLLVYLLQRRCRAAAAAQPAVRAITASFGNNAQLGIPMAAALFGEIGLQLHLSIVSLHALILLTVLTLLVERDLAHAMARDAGAPASLSRTLLLTARNTVIHPIVLPVLAGMAWNLTGAPIPGPIDEVLQMLGTAVVPLCLVAIGLSLGHYGLRGAAGPALLLAAAKLLVQPALVLAVGYGMGLRGLALAVIVMAAAMPTGSNALMFAQRYRSGEAEATAAIVISTLAFAATAPLWLLLTQWLS
ncbi:AEC family transporter [Methylibium petroleiphilum]|uniref:Putative MdcF malonate transporter n=1 Tax=Methylibium petroleiphilum (strain ATCC BAA-1232 / LMG 22953 / PM1) TaxID=420662 RepID=A2SCE1_METPP|nr:AEC family transporter [Methylibium petroleiphilum]ABM93230.1 putative MdcF malonate transporter [Methylibium petroleiphilum PM1]